MNADVRTLLDRVAGLGGFFGLPDAGAEAWPESHQYTAAELYEGDGWPVIADRTGTRLGGDRRVLLSVAQLGYLARLLSPILGAAVVAGKALVIPPGALVVRQTAAGGLRLALGEGARLDGLEKLSHAITDLHLTPLTARLRHALAPTLQAGNAASALAGAVKVLPPGLRPEGARLLAELLARPPLAGAFTAPGLRRTCCLFLKLPGGGACGDCPVPARSVVPGL
ncbi:(2Fe-2S)-binding protein [Phytomonospora sp. NPDC050363]|uniref:(2Fe-2S)-binding protein n=1 Tax=Phytomonospora sp. NPDC050363 TaxID=3155642 RepID=UPI0033EEDB2B